MREEQVKGLFLNYQEKIKATVFGQEVFPDDEINPSKTQALRHGQWMIGQMLALLENPDKKEEVQKWLGFIQGILWCCGIYSIAKLREHNR